MDPSPIEGLRPWSIPAGTFGPIVRTVGSPYLHTLGDSR
jgi:hypothetical protein